MSDKPVCLVTGATSGIGTATAVAMAEHGYHVALLGRSADKLQTCKEHITQQTGSTDLSLYCGDLAVLDDVRRLAKEFIDSGMPLHRLISNAGVTNNQRRLTVDGYEEMFAVNHLAPLLLCNLLLDTVTATEAARIIVVASGAHAFHKGIKFDDPHFESGFSSMKVYGHSKLANILFTRELSKRLEGTGVTANSCHPGAVGTNLGKNNGLLGKVLMGALKPFFRTPEKGAETSIFLACSDEVEGKSGDYYYNCKVAKTKPWAQDDEAAERLWQVSSQMVGL